MTIRTHAHTHTPRLQYDLPVEVRLPDGRALHCRSHDIDSDGITLRSPYNAKAGIQYLLHFAVLVAGTVQEIAAAATVTQSYLVGEEDIFHVHLHFKTIAPEQHEHLDAFLQEHKRP